MKELNILLLVFSFLSFHIHIIIEIVYHNNFQQII